MRPITLNPGHTLPEFQALLAGRNFAYAEAFQIKLISGTVLGYTTAQKDFTVPPCDGSVALQTYLAGDVLVDGIRLKVTSGQNPTPGDPTVNITVDEQTMTLTPDTNPAIPSTIDGVPFIEAVGLGALDKAVVQRDRWFFDGPGLDPVGGMPMFYGYASSIDERSRSQVLLKVKSDLILLNTMMPRNLYQPNCIYTVYSTPCGALKSAFVVHTVMGAAPTRTFIPWAGATTQFSQGEVHVENGPDVGVTRSIRQAVAGVGLYLAGPLPYVPLAGDAFAAYPGCDRQYGGGCAYFGRQTAFRATPYVPEPQMAV